MEVGWRSEIPPGVVNVVNGAGGDWRISGDLETYREGGVYRFDGKWVNDRRCVRHAEYYSSDAGVRRQVAQYLLRRREHEEDAFDKSVEAWPVCL